MLTGTFLPAPAGPLPGSLRSYLSEQRRRPAEAWHALALFAGLYPKDEKYANAFGKMWSYVTKEVVDPQYGGWYNSGLDSNPRTVNERKAHAWKGCYHDGRALMQVREYSNKL